MLLSTDAVVSAPATMARADSARTVAVFGVCFSPPSSLLYDLFKGLGCRVREWRHTK